MSAALTSHPDLSNGSHEISLGSLASFSATPGRPVLRMPSTSSRTTAQSSAPISTPSPPSVSYSRRKDDAATSLSSRLNMLNHQDEDGEDGIDGDVLDTPGGQKKKWTDAPDTPGSRSKRPAKGGPSNGKGVTLTLRDQEKVHQAGGYSYIRHLAKLLFFFQQPTAHRQPQEGELQYKASRSLPRRTTSRASTGPNRCRPQTEHQPQS